MMQQVLNCSGLKAVQLERNISTSACVSSSLGTHSRHIYMTADKITETVFFFLLASDGCV